MTLFKKVFQKHLEEQVAAEGGAPAPAPPPQLAMPGPEVHPDLPEMMAAPSAVAKPEVTPAPADPDVPPAPPELDPALVARAAEAHRMMVETQSRQAPSAPDAPLPGRAVPTAPDAAPTVSSRTRTRLLGFDANAAATVNPIEAASAAPVTTPFPCGWLVIVDGPGRGNSFALHAGAAMIGRGEDQAICIDFGDRAISRQNHAAVAYDTETGKFYLGHGGKSNIIRLNNSPVLSTEELHHGDTIRIGETYLRFAAFCDDTFTWSDAEE